MELSIWEELKSRLNFHALGKPALIGLAALIVMVAVFAGKNLTEAATANDFEMEGGASAQSVEASSTAGASVPSGQSDALDAGDTSSTLFVHVSGAVKKPGLVELKADSRVADAIQAAGGLTKKADIDSINLARTLEDGEQIIVARKGDKAGIASEAASTAQAGVQQPIGDGDTAAGPRKVNVNTATATELESLPGIGPTIAERIVSERTANGAFSSLDDLMRVSGIGEKKLEAIIDVACV